MTRVSLTIAGSDPSGGAGIQADLKTFHQCQTYGMSVITLLTVQNTTSVDAVRVLDPDFVTAQLKAVVTDIPPHAAKTGALGNAELIDALSSRAERFDFPLVVDPVMISKHGAMLLDADGQYMLRRKLLPCAYLVTPNIPEAEQLSERSIGSVADMERAAISIGKLGAKHVLLKGGHLEEDATDVLLFDGELIRFPSAHLETEHTHGTGCVYSAAVTALLARNTKLPHAVGAAKKFVHEAIRTAPGLGHGKGPINLFAPLT